MSASSPAIAGWYPVWRRNFLVWRKLALPSILGNLADPLIYMLGLGYGLICLEVHFLVFHAAPESFNKDIVNEAALAVHADFHSVV